MAALTTTDLVGRTPRGRFFQVTLSVVVASSAAADEWTVTGLEQILSVDGIAVQGATTRTVNVVMNAQGTGVAAGTNPGDLGIEASGACTAHVTVTGR